MKRKFFIILLALISVLCCAFCLSACGGGSGGVNGTYYAYENGKLDKSQYITLNGGKWSDDDDANGTYKINGTEIVFYAEVFGSNEEMYSGTLSDGVLKIKVMGANMTYCKEGSEPANGNGDGNTETPPETKNEYTVTYDANGGAFSDGKTTVTQKAKEGSTLTAPVSPSRTASAFSGWATDKGGKTLWKFASDTVTKNITLYAVWDEQSAAIISADGATIDESKMSVYMLVDRNTESVSLSNKIVCSTDSVWRLYYDRLGQTEIPTKIAAGLSGELKNGDNIFYIVVTSSNGAQVNVYELTVHRSYSVTVNYYDNKENLIKTDTAYTGYEYEVSYTPDISGYTFNYWKDKSGKKATSVIPENSVSFYADCTAKTYKATLNVNGGNALDKTEYTVTYDKGYGFAAPTRTGYTFAGWYSGETKLTGANGNSLENWTYAGARTLTAKWTANSYKLTLNKDVPEGGTVTGDGNYNYDATVTVSASTADGYTWLGWYDSEGKLVTDKFNYSFKMGFAKTYTAKWIKVTLEKSFDEAGSVTSLSGTYKAGNEVTVKATSNNLIGYTWLGWYNGETELTKELNYTFLMPTESATYTAKWKIDERMKVFNFISTESRLTVTSIKDKTVTEIIVPDIVTNISEGAFNGCSSLESITIPFVGSSITAVTDTYQYPFGYIFGTYSYTGGVSTIQDYYGSSISVLSSARYYIPSSLRSVTVTGGNILYGAFYGCSRLTSITIPDSVISIGKSAFVACRGLTNITIPDSVTSIGGEAFYGCSGLTNITIPDSVTSIGSSAFSGCSRLTSITIPDGVTSIGSSAFYGCSGLTSVSIPDSVTSIGYFTFYGCSGLTSIIIPDGVTTIDSSTFYNCSGLTSISIPDGVTSIGNEAFRGCNGLTSVSIPDGVTSIDEQAFSGCSRLTSITIPDSVTSIGGSAFEGCSSLTIYCEAANKPNGWDRGWNYSNCPVVWNYKAES